RSESTRESGAESLRAIAARAALRLWLTSSFFLIRFAMTFDNDAPDLRSAHVIVVGNEKGGAGKATISIHLAVALLKAGRKVACIDLDTRQQTLTRFFENRKSWSANAPWQ